MQPVCDAYKPWDETASWDELAGGQLALYALWLVESSVQQEGFHGFLWNQAGFHLSNALTGARLIAAEPYIPILEAVLRVFPLNTAPVSAAQRRELLILGGDSSEAHLDRLSEDFYALLRRSPTLRDYCVRYIRSRPEEFFR